MNKRLLNLLWAAALLLSVDNARAFYNPTTGRWLSRDPIEERGGVALYAFVANNPISHIDDKGLDMSLFEHFYPVAVPLVPGYQGITAFRAFRPRAKVYRGIESPCCWKIYLSGYADLTSWWVVSGIAPNGIVRRGSRDAACGHWSINVLWF